MKSSRGFTLIELIVAIAVGSFLIAGIVLFTQQQTSDGIRVKDYLAVLHLAKMKLAETNNMAYASLATGSVVLPDEASFPGFDIQRTVSDVATATVGGQTIRLRQYSVNIDYAGGAFTNPLVRLVTYRQSQTTFGDGV